MSLVFVLEDDTDLRNLYSRALDFRGYEVTATESAEQAIEMLDDGALRPDIAVLDMSMPGLPGSAVVDYIRNKTNFSNLPIIVISCDESFKITLKSSDVTFMPKPISIADLYSAVAKLVS